MKILISALAIVCIIEALPWIINAQKMKDSLSQLSQIPNENIKHLALAIFSVGCVVLWLTLQA